MAAVRRHSPPLRFAASEARREGLGRSARLRVGGASFPRVPFPTVSPRVAEGWKRESNDLLVLGVVTVATGGA